MSKNTTIVLIYSYHRHKIPDLIFCNSLYEESAYHRFCTNIKGREYYIPEGHLCLLHTDQVFCPDQIQN
jgi:hypothetical protein